ncbi:MAG: ABC transporter permease [Syntrophobacterales bacterium]|nr:ABC transporter permease [Syntrophobacterales bacterium]
MFTTLLFSPLIRWQLIKSLVKRDLIGRYRGSFFGFLWTVVQPLTLVVIYYFVCSIIFRLALKGVHYNFFEFLICGLLPWLAFGESLNRSSMVVVEQGYLVKKVFFPSEVLIPVVVLSSMVQLAMGLGVFGIYLLISKVELLVTYWWHLLFLPLLFLIQFTLSAGLGWFVGSINVFWRDVGHVLSLLMNVWFYITPIIYPYEIIPGMFRSITYLNPAFHLIESYRWVFLGEGRVDLLGLTYLVGISIILYFVGGLVFGKLKEDFSSVL